MQKQCDVWLDSCVAQRQASRLPEKAGMCQVIPGTLSEPGETVTQAQGWSQPCMGLVLSSMACDTSQVMTSLMGGGETCRTSEGGARKGAGRW